MPTKEDLLKGLTVKQLKQLAKDNHIGLVSEGFLWNSVASTKEDIIDLLAKSPKISKDKILSKSKGTETFLHKEEKEKDVKEVEHKGEVKPVKRGSDTSIGEVNFHKLVNDIQSIPFIPSSKESGYENQLYVYLNAKGFNVQHEKSRRGSRFDLVIGNDEVAVELKVIRGTSQFDALIGQIMRYRRDFKKIIIVLRDEFRNPSVLREETKRIQDIDPDNIVVIIK